MKKNAPITQETVDAITAALEAKGLDPESVPAEFAESQSLKSRELADLPAVSYTPPRCRRRGWGVRRRPASH